MAKKISLVLGIFFIAFSLSAANVYVSSFRTNLYKKKARSSAKVKTLRRGYKLKVVKKSGSWLKVKSGSKTGWVKRIFTSKMRPSAKVSLLGRGRSNARVHARRRASSDVTAASARGLVDDKSSRSRMVKVKFDARVLEDMEAVYVSEESLLKFLQDGGVQ